MVFLRPTGRRSLYEHKAPSWWSLPGYLLEVSAKPRTLSRYGTYPGQMSEPTFITQADALNEGEIVVNLSDGQTLLLTLDQLMAARATIVPVPEEDEESS